jgi:hypothetical protein
VLCEAIAKRMIGIIVEVSLGIKTKTQDFRLGFFFDVGAAGFEPAAPWSQTRCATGLRYAPNNIFSEEVIRQGLEPRTVSLEG